MAPVSHGWVWQRIKIRNVVGMVPRMGNRFLTVAALFWCPGQALDNPPLDDRRHVRFGILTSVEIRHRYFARALSEAVDVVAVGYERTGFHPGAVEGYDLTDAERAVVAGHFDDRTKAEERFFGGRTEMLRGGEGVSTLRIEPGGLNSEETVSLLDAAGVDAVAVYGTNLIRPPLLDRWSGRMLNMHLGLSPYYRGIATNFYPLLNEEPEFVGATIHLIDAGIDSGPIIRHARPEIRADDMPHTIGCKAILAGIEAMIRSMREFEAGSLRPVAQWDVPDGRLCLRKDYHPRQVVELYAKLDAGLIPRYLERAPMVRDRIRLIP